MNKLREQVARYGRQFRASRELDYELADELITLIRNDTLDEKWISVDDRLPDVGDFVIWTNGDWVAYTTFVAKTGFITSTHVTHWMPLPEPPIDNLRGESK